MSDAREAVCELEKEVGFCLRGFVPGTSLIPKHLQIPVSNLANYLRDTLGLSSEGTHIGHTHTHTHTHAHTHVGPAAAESAGPVPTPMSKSGMEKGLNTNKTKIWL